MKRNDLIDNLRALAILMVVFGHSIILYQYRWGIYTSINDVPILNAVKNYIDVIQMPLFISLSGYLYFKIQGIERIIVFFVKKIRRLLVPFVAIGIFWMIPIRLFVEYPWYENKEIFEIIIKCLMLGQDCGHLWFLPFLFLAFMLSHFLAKIFKVIVFDETKCWWTLTFIAGLLYISKTFFQVSFLEIYHLNNVATYYIWFLVGGLLFRYQDQINSIPEMLVICVAILISLGFFMEYLDRGFLTSGILLITIYRLMRKKSNNLTVFLSKNSFGIYLFHSPLVYITYSTFSDINPLIVVLTNFVLGGSIALIITMILRKTRLKIIIGE